jgi:ribosomal-protein-serine acetyltransferase
MFTHRLDDDRLLRPYAESDAEELYALIDAEREMLSRWMPWAPGQTLEGVREYIATTRRQLADDDGFQAAIVERGAIVGSIGFHRLDRVNRSSSLGYWLAAEAQGRGTVTLATAALIDWAFTGPWRLHRLEIRAGVANARSRAVPARLGFTFEGVLRGAENLGDGWLDHAVYGLLADEWAGLPAR